jgi:hypothetical protein
LKGKKVLIVDKFDDLNKKEDLSPKRKIGGRITRAETSAEPSGK